MPADDSQSLGEISRNLATLVTRFDAFNVKIDGLSQTYTPREVHDLDVGGIKIDLRRLDEERKKSETQFAALEQSIDRRYRQNVTLTISCLLAPLTLLLVGFALTQLAAR